MAVEPNACPFQRALYSGGIRWVNMELTPYLYTKNENEWNCVSMSHVRHCGAVSWHTHLTLTLYNFSLQRDYDLPVLSELRRLQQPGQQSQYSYYATRWTRHGLIPNRCSGLFLLQGTIPVLELT